MEENDSIKASDGLVAFFDILGYKQILVNNHVREAASIVKSLLETVTSLQQAAERARDSLKFPKLTHYLAFSDSILVYTNYSKIEQDRELPRGMFLAGCTALCADLFAAGLPARGAIAKGEFYVEGATFAGKAIVEAYEFANTMEMAGCIVIPTAESEFENISDVLNLRMRYEVPLKGHQRQELLTLNLCFTLLAGSSEDARAFTIKQFGQHNKNIGPEVIGKVNNTANFLVQARKEIVCTGLKTQP